MKTASKAENNALPSAGIGAHQTRLEDDALLRGAGRFIDDIDLKDQLYATFIRSPHANARVVHVDSKVAHAEETTVAVFSAADLGDKGEGNLWAQSTLTSRDGTPIKNPPVPAMVSHARYVGDTVAMVVATTTPAAEDAAALVDIEYAVEDAVCDPATAVLANTPQVWPEFDSNIALDWQSNDGAAVERAFSQAAHVARVSVTNNRIVVAALETRGALAQYDDETNRTTLWTPTQGGSAIQQALVRAKLCSTTSEIRVITPDVGGGFGIKNGIYTEQFLVAWAARRLRRPIKWSASRSDAFQTDYHARDHRMTAELALDKDARFLAIRCDVVSNMGAYLTDAGPVIPTLGGPRMLANVYRTPLSYARARCVFTNTTPIAAFRGAGKPEYAYLVEALVDRAAADLGLSRAEIRRRNLIATADLPWQTPTGLNYDSGDFLGHLEAGVGRQTESAYEKQRQSGRARGKLCGFGFSLYTEPDGFKDNRVTMSFDPDGRLSVTTSAQTNGQNHATTYTQIAVSLLAVAPNDISIIEGDTDRCGLGSGSGGSRSTTVTGAAMHHCAVEIINKATAIAAHSLETNVTDIELRDGHFRVVGTDRKLSWRQVAANAHDPNALPEGMQTGLEAQNHYDAPNYCYPAGCHTCDVEIDIDTGRVDIVRYASHSDFGTIINPMLVEGQLHGGIAQGIGQALQEYTAFDDASGQLLSGSFMDYSIPKATDLPDFETEFVNTRCLTNPLGTKGCGESGPTAAIPAVASAVLDALSDYDTTSLTMPFTVEKIWRVLHADDQTSGNS